MKTIKGITAGLLVAAVLSACGGGGGGGDDGDIGVALQPLIIDANNAMQVSAAVLDASELVVDVGEPGGPITGVAVEGDGAQFDLAELVRARLDLFSVLHAQAAAAQVTGVVFDPVTLDCLNNGSVTISGDVDDPLLDTLAPGDTLSAVFSNCDDGDGLVVNGSLDMVVVSFSGAIDLDPNAEDFFVPPYDFTFNTTLNNLSITEIVSGSTFTANGNLTLSEATPDGVFFESEFTGDSLSVRTPETTDTLSDYLILATLDEGNQNAYSMDSNGTLASTLLNGIVDFLTTSLFTGFGDAFPNTGVMVISGETIVGGAGPSSVEVIAEDSQCVRLLVDENGDGGTDADIVTTWDSLSDGIPVDCVPL
jgi:hypothetical protein